MPTAHLPPPTAPKSHDKLSVTIPKSQAHALRQLAARHNTTVSGLIAAALELYLASLPATTK